MYLILWRFRPKDGCEAAFQAAYGPEGDWARLCCRARGFIATELWRSSEAPVRFLTVDRWESEECYRQFRQEFEREYVELDRLLEGLVDEETPLGEYVASVGGREDR